MPLFTHRSFEVTFSRFFVRSIGECRLKGAAQYGLGDGDEFRGGQFALGVPPSTVQQPPWEIHTQKSFS